MKPIITVLPILLASGLMLSTVANADAVSDWNETATNLIYDAIKPPPPAYRTLALVQTSVLVAVNAITDVYEPIVEVSADDGASVEAAVAAATRESLIKLVPTMTVQIDELYQMELDKLPADESRAAGVAVGTNAAAAVLQMRIDDKPSAAKNYRPVTAPGVWVPTIVPAAVGWAESKKPWALDSTSQFRPGPPPELTSQRWADDFNEILQIGASDSSVRTEQQTIIAKFWQATAPKVYLPIVRSITNQQGREITRNARLLAAAVQAADDALAAVFDAKHTYQFWRPLTAIRNGDQDGNDATSRREDWSPLINTPMHPEYPCAHCIVAASIGTVIDFDLGSDPVPMLKTVSPTDSAISRSWKSTDGFIKEVSNARVWEGVHFRNSAQVGEKMGRQIGEAVATSLAMQ